MPDFSQLKLPFWMNKGELAKLLAACKKFWSQLHGWLIWPTKQFDPLVCPLPVLNLLAWERDITRFNGEPLDLYRKRVAFAWVNARDAGSVEGFIAIFHRLGIGYVELLERQKGKEWDEITIRVSDGQIASNGELLREIIRQYGRTCRRYDYEVITINTQDIRAGWYTGEYVVYTASK
ncbi:phage tail protein [Citrobacter portucalensis]|uniref:phage tail protein n=1 Tax=Citrobacter portucalensis TaxID=1639133 RepID=UPI00226B133C|nr:phage tail protein [Citrobacter portucalensis]MCX9039463.1 phage tail protein [Citrobacter portucalensis]MCX9061101.1 phage tail protein [Citrobacter portucalensis]